MKTNESIYLCKLTEAQINKIIKSNATNTTLLNFGDFQTIELETVGDVASFNLMRKAVLLYSPAQLESLLKINSNDVLTDTSEGKDEYAIPLQKRQYVSMEYVKAKLKKAIHVIPLWKQEEFNKAMGELSDLK